MRTGEIIRFGLTGAVNTLVGLAAIAFAQVVLSLGPYWSNAFGYAVGLACSYLLNSRWTFRTPGSVSTLLRFVPAFLLAYGCNLAALDGLLRLKTPWLLAQAVALFAYSALFFLLCKFVVFRRPRDSALTPAPDTRK